MRSQFSRCLFVMAFLAACCAAQPANVSGTWNLNVGKSSWGKKVKPQSVMVTVQHNEPALKYSGTVKNEEGAENTFQFEGAIDGKPYATTSDYGPAKITYKRVNPLTTSSELKSDDGKFVENATVTVSKDGKTLTRRLRTKGPQGSASWTEVYDKQQ